MRQRPAAEDCRRLQQAIDRFPGTRVALLGDLVADEFVHGDIDRVSREAPVLILSQQSSEVVPGGAGNAAANLFALDARPVPVGVIGKDDPGERLRQWFVTRKVPTTHLLRHAAYPTPTKTRIIAGGVHTRRQQIVRIDRGRRTGELDGPTRTALRGRLMRALAGADGLLVADYGYGSAPPTLVRGLRRTSGRQDRFVAIDSRYRADRFRGATVCTPNQEEVERLLGHPLRGDRSVERAAGELRRRTGNLAVLITRGSRGMSLVGPADLVRHIRAWGSEEVADVTGAGDTVIAVLSLAWASGADPVDAARLANYAAGLVVMKAGTATVSRRELRAAVIEDLG